MGAAVVAVIGAAVDVQAQALKDLQTPDTPLVLKAQGSFFVGGDRVEQTQGELGDLGPGGHITVNQMYVRYMVPQGGEGNVISDGRLYMRNQDTLLVYDVKAK